MQKKIDLKYYLLMFIETFNIWQMGIIFYSSKTLTINNLVHTPFILENSILIVFIGYIIGILAIYIYAQKTILMGKIAVGLSLLCSIALLFSYSNITVFLILYYILTFCCVFFISVNMSLIINYYSVKTALLDVISGAIVSGLFIAICQNNLLPLPFETFNIVSIICLLLITFAFFKLPENCNISFIEKDDTTTTLPSKKLILNLCLIHFLAAQNVIFTNSIAESITNGVFTSYIGVLIAGLLFIILNKIKRISEYKICTYYFVITAIGFLMYLTPISEAKYLSILLQGFGFFILFLTPYLGTNLFEKYPSKKIAPIAVSIALLAVVISSGILEIFRNNQILLYSIYSFISVFSTIIYLLFEKELEFNYRMPKTNTFEKLTERESEVANLLVKGYTAKEIAGSLFISEYTVKDHIKSIYKKYNVNSKIKFVSLINNGDGI